MDSIQIAAASPVDMWAVVVAIAAVVTAVGTVALAIIAGVGLRSLKLAQSDMITRAVREARAASIQRARELADEIIPLNSKILREFAEKAIPVFVTDATQVRFGTQEEVAARESAAEWVASLEADLYAQCVTVLNRTESWAMSFTGGIADADTAYPTCSSVFCALVIQLYPVLVTLRNRDQSGNFPHLVTLFENWYGTKLRERKLAEAQALLQQVHRMQTHGGGYKRLPDPIGTVPLK